MSALLLFRSGSGVTPTLRCVVLLNGQLRVMPQEAPYGSRLILSNGRLVAAATGGKSLIYDTTLGLIRQQADGELVATPP